MCVCCFFEDLGDGEKTLYIYTVYHNIHTLYICIIILFCFTHWPSTWPSTLGVQNSGYEHVLDPPLMMRDVNYWLNYEQPGPCKWLTTTAS